VRLPLLALGLGAGLLAGGGALLASTSGSESISQGGQQLVSTMPSCDATTDGKMVVFQTSAMAAAGLAWRFRCNSASASIYRWEFAGGEALRAEVDADETVPAATTSYVDLTTPGPSLAPPIAGEYVIEHGVRGYPWAVNQTLLASYDIGPADASDADAIWQDLPANLGSVGSRARTKALGRNMAVVMKYRHSSTAAQANFAKRWLSLTPVRVIGGDEPTNSVLPTVSGTAAVGYRFDGTVGTWSGSPTHYTFQWQRCSSAGTNCVTVSSTRVAAAGAVVPTYSSNVFDGDMRLRLRVVAENPYGSTAAVSATTATLGGAIPTSGLAAYLDAGRPVSYTLGQGNAWYDLSGNGRHFYWDYAYWVDNGDLDYFSTSARTATGPASNSFGLSDNVGYTVLFVSKLNSWTYTGTFKFYGSGGYSRGVFMHGPWSDGNFYFDQGGCCNADTRTWVGAGVNTWSYFLSGVTRNGYYDRRIWRGNGNQLAGNGNWSAGMALDGRGAQINARDEGYNWDANIVAFIVYNRALSQAEISTIYWAYASRGIAN